MSELERIKALAAAAPAGPWQMDPETYHVLDADGDGLAYDLMNEETALLMAEARTLVPKLVALIEKLRDDAAQRATEWEATADRLWKQIRDRDPERNLEDAQRYTAYAISHRGNAHIIDKIIKEGLTQ